MTSLLDNLLAADIGQPIEEGSQRVIAGRFRAERLLRIEPGLETLFGRDAGGGPVILRVAQAEWIGPGAQLRLTHEASLWSQIQSDRLAPLLAFGRTDESLYWVRRFTPGVSLQT